VSITIFVCAIRTCLPDIRSCIHGGFGTIHSVNTFRLRLADAEDAEAIAALHADSWRRHYRGAYADAFLDGDVTADRRRVWTDRLGQGDPATRTILAERHGAVVGFAHTILDQDPIWGALLDNLHVAADAQRQGIGEQLMVSSAAFVVAERPSSGLYLWVLEQNVSGQRFYERLGGEPVETSLVPPVGGVSGRLNGAPACLRYAWRDLPALAGRAGLAVRD
jgi:ribosomal protein S18 acetylase RimI-like enzyme